MTLHDIETDRQPARAEPELLDVYAACTFLGGSRPINPATLWRGVKSGRYSRPIKIGANSTRWRRSELAADIERLASERDAATAA